MELSVLTDGEGNIIAVHRVVVSGPTEAVPSAAMLVARHGQRVHTVTLTPELERASVEEIHQTMSVHIVEGAATLRHRSPGQS